MTWKNCYLTKDKANASINCSLSSNYTVTSKLKIHVNNNIKLCNENTDFLSVPVLPDQH